MVVTLRDGAARDDAAAAPQLLDDQLAVDGERQRLLHQRVIERRDIAVHADAVEAGVQRAHDAGGRVGVHPIPVIGRQLGDDIHLALEQARDPRRHLWDGADDHPIEVGLAPPVIPVGLHHDLVVLGPRDEAHRPRADGLGIEGVSAHRLQVLLRHDLPAIEGQALREQRVGLLGVDDEGRGVGRLDSVDGGEHRGHAGPDLRVPGALEAPLRVGRGERVPVVPLDPLADLEDPGCLPLELPLRGQPRVELAVGVPAHQVVEEVERDPDVVGRGAEVRVELGDVAALRPHQLALLGGLGRGGACQRVGDRGDRASGGGALEKVTSGECHVDSPFVSVERG